MNDTGVDIEGRSLPVDDGAATRARSLRTVLARELEPKRELCLGGYTGEGYPRGPLDEKLVYSDAKPPSKRWKPVPRSIQSRT